MAEAVGLASAIVSLVSTAYSSCQKLYSTFDGLRNAPKHIATISNDLEDFYLVLGTIQELLDDKEFSASIVQYARSENLCGVLDHCLMIFEDLNIIISEYQGHSKDSKNGSWQRLKWTFKKPKVDDLRSNLMGCKATLNMAISVANCYNMRATSASTARIEEDVAAQRQALSKLPEILQQMEDLRVAQLPQALPHGAVDRAGIKIDYGFALRRHTDDAASICSDLNTPSAPSLQVSAFESSNGQLTSRFYTAPESQGSNSIDRQTSRKCTQILVRNVGLYKTIALQVMPDHTIDTIKSLVRARIGLEIAEFELLYSSRVLDSSDRSIADYGIPHDATLTCISFRLNQPPPPVTPQEIYLMDLTHKKYQLYVTNHTKVCEVKEMHANQQGGDLKAAGITLIYWGQHLQNDRRLYEDGIGPGSTVYMQCIWY